MTERTRRGVECIVLLLLSGVFSRISTSRASDPVPATASWDSGYRTYVGTQSVSVGATVRTFAGGASPDFPRTSAAGAGRYANIMGDELGLDGDPVFRSTGQRIISPWMDAAGHVISPPRDFIASRPGDVAGRLDTTPGGAVTSESTFNQWFDDVAGVNTSARSPVNFAYDSGKYVFNGSLDTLNGGRNLNYTTEIEIPFVYEAGRDFYFAAESSAELWVYIDGKLVIDGGGMPAPPFSITNGTVVPGEPVNATVTVVGSAIQSGSTQVPVTVRVTAGSQNFEPFGSYTDPSRGNVNDNRNPRASTLSSTIAAGSAISVSGQSWLADSRGRLASYIALSSTPASAGVKVLRDGDPVPRITPFANQTSINTYLRPYLNTQTGLVTLGAHETIFLFELGTRTYTSTAADFQDLVVLVGLARTTGGSATSGTSSGGGSTTSLSQRFDLARLAGLEDRGSYTIKILFANRTGSPSTLKMETNIVTLNLANRPVWPGHD